jgi:hypothetical protein
MTEYFYTSSLVYAAAAVEHRFEGGESLRITGWENMNYSIGEFAKLWRFPKTPHNVALMNKQEFDVVKQIGKVMSFNKVGIIEYNMNRKLFVQHSGFDDFYIDDWIITERGGFPFPVWDKEGVCF